MKYLLIALAVLAPAIAQAASLEDKYIAARDASIAKLTAAADSAPDMEGVLKDQEAAMTDLETQLRQMIGPSAIKGFPAEGKISLDTLLKTDEGFGLLDGLVYTSDNEKARVVVTSNALLARWMRAHKNWWRDMDNVPQDVAEAVTSTAFYTQAISTDSQIAKYAEIPVVKPAKARLSFAMLAWYTQDIGPGVPDRIVLSVVRAKRVFLVSSATNLAMPIPACDAIWRAFEEQSEKIAAADREAENKGQTRKHWSEQPREDASLAFHRCYQTQAKNQPFFAALKQQAQEIVDALPDQ